MRSTMMDTPLLISRLLEHGATVHGSAEVVTATAPAPSPAARQPGPPGAAPRL